MVHVAIGGRQADGRYRPGRACGIIAIGLVAIGGVAVGLVGVGGVAVGLVAMGAVTAGLVIGPGCRIRASLRGIVAADERPSLLRQ